MYGKTARNGAESHTRQKSPGFSRGEEVKLPGLESRLDEGLADAIDRINHRYGAMHAGIGYAGIRGRGRDDADTGADWRMRRTMLSPRATTRWDEIAIARAT